MSHEYEREYELTASRDEVAAILRNVVDGITAGSIRLRDGGEDLDIAVPQELEVELEIEDGGLSLEFELEWPSPEVEVEIPGEEGLEEKDEPPIPIEATGSPETLARFELFRDQSNEWCWRLRHRNGNTIATSGEGYTRKHNARKGDSKRYGERARGGDKGGLIETTA